MTLFNRSRVGNTVVCLVLFVVPLPNVLRILEQNLSEEDAYRFSWPLLVVSLGSGLCPEPFTRVCC